MVVLENERCSITSSNYAERSVEKSSNMNHHGSLTSQSAPVFILCERCRWYATYFDTNRILKEEGVDDDKQ